MTDRLRRSSYYPPLQDQTVLWFFHRVHGGLSRDNSTILRRPTATRGQPRTSEKAARPTDEQRHKLNKPPRKLLDNEKLHNEPYRAGFPESQFGLVRLGVVG